MEGIVRFDCCPRIVGLNGRLESCVGNFKCSQVFRCEVRYGQFERVGFEALYQSVKLICLVWVEWCDTGISARGGFDQALIVEPLEGFPYRCTADPEALGKFGVADGFAGLQVAFNDPVTQLRVNLFSSGGTLEFFGGGDRHGLSVPELLDFRIQNAIYRFWSFHSLQPMTRANMHARKPEAK